MTNKYIEIEMLPTAYGVGGSFHAEASFALDNFKSPFYNIEEKLIQDVPLAQYPSKD